MHHYSAHPAHSVLMGTLRGLVTQERLAQEMTLPDDADEKFWKQQFRLVETRFFSYILTKLSWPLTTISEDLTVPEIVEALDMAEDLIDKGLTYEQVREWWKAEGQAAHKAAFQAKHDADRLARASLVALVFFEKGRPLYLTYDADDQLTLTEDRDSAEPFDVLTLEDLEPARLKAAAESEEFLELAREVGGTHLKLLPNIH